jgi:Winged helix-turn helix
VSKDGGLGIGGLRLRKKKRQELRQELNDVWEHKLAAQTRSCAKHSSSSRNTFKLLLVRPLRMFDLKLGGTSRAGVECRRMRPEEVSMRPPEVFVRELAQHEGQRLKRLSKQSKLASTRQRALILLASNTLMSAPEIARMLLTDESHVRKVIHDFNQHGSSRCALVSGAGDPPDPD